MADTEKTVVTEETSAETAKKAEKNSKKSAKANKPGLGAKISKFFKDYKSEIKKIVWYGKKQTIKSTGLVIVSLVVVSALVSLIDLGLSSVIMWLGTLI